ncbi:hypothetical protein Plhal304r1_c009g0035981 [Plasmopara halstedii]
MIWHPGCLRIVKVVKYFSVQSAEYELCPTSKMHNRSFSLPKNDEVYGDDQEF